MYEKTKNGKTNIDFRFMVFRFLKEQAKIDFLGRKSISFYHFLEKDSIKPSKVHTE